MCCCSDPMSQPLLPSHYRQTYPSRWLTLSAALVFLAMSGLAYAFSLISETLKDRLVLTQSQLSTIGILGTVGANSGVIAGVFNNRYGPQTSIWVGVCIICIGYGLLAVITTQYLSIKSVALTSFANFLFNHGTAWFSTVSIPLLAQNFPEKDHGKLLGLGKGYMGIGSAFFATFKTDLANGDVKMFMISTMAFLVIASLVFGRFIVLLPPQLTSKYLPNEIPYGKDKRCGLSIAMWYIVSFLFAIYLVVNGMMQTVFTLGDDDYIRYILFGVVMLLWSLPIMLALCAHGKLKIKYKGYHDRSLQLETNTGGTTKGSFNTNTKGSRFMSADHMGCGLTFTPPMLSVKESVDTMADSHHRHSAKSMDVGMPDIFGYWQLYVLYMICTIVSGSAITFMDNTPQIIESASSNAFDDVEDDTVSTSMVVIASFGSFCGRVLGGFLVDYYAGKCHCSLWLIVPPLMMSLTMSGLFVAGTNLMALRIGGLFIGVAFGWLHSLVVVSVSNLWGTKYLSGNFSLFDSTCAVGGVIFSTCIFASIYDQFAEAEKGEITYFIGSKCYGSDCYRYTFLICACSSAVALILSFINWRCTPKHKRNCTATEEGGGIASNLDLNESGQNNNVSAGDMKEDLMMYDTHLMSDYQDITVMSSRTYEGHLNV